MALPDASVGQERRTVPKGRLATWALVGKSDGTYVSTGTHRYAAGGRAIVSDPLQVGRIPDWPTAKIPVTTASGNGRATFVGVARKADVDRYLAGGRIEMHLLEKARCMCYQPSVGSP